MVASNAGAPSDPAWLLNLRANPRAEIQVGSRRQAVIAREATPAEADDIEAIRRLKARYSRTMDTKDWAGMREVFTDDVVIDTSEAGVASSAAPTSSWRSSRRRWPAR